jgi:hypothetical protein
MQIFLHDQELNQYQADPENAGIPDTRFSRPAPMLALGSTI